MRLDLFVPFLKKAKKNAAPPVDRWLLKFAKRILPASFFADRITGKPGLIRRVLRRIGPTVLSSPVRRCVQAVCFLLFLWLFFYTCWPYTAAPQPSHLLSDGWSIGGADPASGPLTLTRETPLASPPAVGDRVHLVDAGMLHTESAHVGEFEVSAAGDDEMALQSVRPLSEQQRERLQSSGPWALYDADPWPSHYADELSSKEFVSAETFLIIDPLVAISTAIAARSWVWSLTFAGVILVICVLVPRGFCGYLCPLGTLIDLFDWAIGRRVTWLRVRDDGWWVHIKYYLLAGTLVCSMFGLLVSGYVAAIPVITRGMLFIGEPLQTLALRESHLVAPMNAGHFVSIGLFFGVLGLGLMKPRFWCKYVCPSGAVFSLGNLFRASERKVESSCINCNKCVEICPFDAIKADFTTRTSDCTLCQTCGGVCPTQAIKFVGRWDNSNLKAANDPPTHETPLGRRGFLSLAAGATAAVVGGVTVSLTARAFGGQPAKPLVRPPGSVPESEFLDMCIRCGECFKACPNNVLQASGFEHGLESLWTPLVAADWAGCESSCNACGQVCPTGAIRALPLEEKRAARMGLAIVDQQTCLPIAGREACQLCVDDCNAAGYHAIEQMRVGTQVDAAGAPIEGSGFLIPIVRADKCVGCGLCQTRCYGNNVLESGKLGASAIVVEAGEGKEDRLMHGSYRELRAAEAKQRKERQQRQAPNPDEFYIPGGSPSVPATDPFGVGPTLDDNPFGEPLPAVPTPVVPTPPAADADPFGLDMP